MTSEIRIPFSDFFQRRKDYNCEVDYVDIGSYYLCKLVLSNTNTLYCEVVKGTQDETDFINLYQPFCNKTIKPGVPNLLTHNFSNSNSWIAKSLDTNSTDSVFVWSPSTGKKLQLREITISCWKNLQLNSGQEIVFTIWESMTESCPIISFTQKTAYNNSAYWVKAWPDPQYLGPTNYPAQEVSIYVCVTGLGIPRFKVTEFKYKTISDLTKKSRKTYFNLIKKNDLLLGDIEEQVSWFPYYDQGIDVTLRYSLNERIECFISNDQPLNNSTSNIPSIATVVFHSYDEW